MKKLDLRKSDDDNRSHVLDRKRLNERRRSSRNNVLEIIGNDLRACFTNPIVILVLLAIIILPSLYGIVNIYACWDPYENTDFVQFAIANDDVSTSYENYTIHAGDDLVESLKSNRDFDWVFVSSDDLRRGVHNGTYYAGIIIPSNFSESIVSITSDNPHHAQLEYIVNEKSNPVAAKLADAGAKAIYNRVNDEIVSFIDKVAYDRLEELEYGLASGADKMEDGANQLSSGADKVSSGADELVAGANRLSVGADELADGSNRLASGASSVSSGATLLSVNSVQLAGGADKVSSGASQVADGTRQVANLSMDTYQTFLKVKHLLENNGDTNKLSGDVEKLEGDTARIADKLDDLNNKSSEVSKQSLDLYNRSNDLSYDSSLIAANANQVAGKTDEISDSYNNISEDMGRLKESLNNNENPSEIQLLLEKIDKQMNVTNQKFYEISAGSSAVANGSSSVAEGASQLADGSSRLADGSNRLVNGSSQLSSGAGQLSSGAHSLANGTVELASGAELLGYSSAMALQNASDSIGLAASQLSTVTGLDDEQVENYFLSPVELKKHEEFPVSNYGSQVAPFYLVLSMWVGALITCVMLKTGSSVGTKYRPHEVYMGKLSLFSIMAVLQTTVTLIGSFILGIDVYNLWLFIFSCYFVSLVFMAIMYSLISLFGEVGKGISILLLVFQISGSGGVYPVEIMNKIFGIIYPYLPMTHGITVVRESQLGLIGSNYLPSFIYLWIVGLIIIIGSIVLKQKWDRRTKYFEEKLEESNLFS